MTDFARYLHGCGCHGCATSDSAVSVCRRRGRLKHQRLRSLVMTFTAMSTTSSWLPQWQLALISRTMRYVLWFLFQGFASMFEVITLTVCCGHVLFFHRSWSLMSLKTARTVLSRNMRSMRFMRTDLTPRRGRSQAHGLERYILYLCNKLSVNTQIWISSLSQLEMQSFSIL